MKKNKDKIQEVKKKIDSIQYFLLEKRANIIELYDEIILLKKEILKADRELFEEQKNLIILQELE